MTNKLSMTKLRELINLYYKEEISISKFLEEINDHFISQQPTMTPKSPEEQAAELYPKFADEISGYREDYNKITELQRAAWLSRQAEVDELRLKYEQKCGDFDISINEQRELKAEVDELKGQVEYDKELLDRSIEQFKDVNTKLSDKEREIAKLSEAATGLTLRCKEHLAEIKELYEQLSMTVTFYGNKIIAKDKQIAIMESLLNDYREQLDKLTSKDETTEQRPQSGDQTT